MARSPAPRRRSPRDCSSGYARRVLPSCHQRATMATMKAFMKQHGDEFEIYKAPNGKDKVLARRLPAARYIASAPCGGAHTHVFKAACSPFSQVRCTTTGHEMEASAVRSSATGTPLRLRGCRQPGSSAVLPCKRQQQQRAQNACPDSQAWVQTLRRGTLAGGVRPLPHWARVQALQAQERYVRRPDVIGGAHAQPCGVVSVLAGGAKRSHCRCACCRLRGPRL